MCYIRENWEKFDSVSVYAFGFFTVVLLERKQHLDSQISLSGQVFIIILTII